MIHKFKKMSRYWWFSIPRTQSLEAFIFNHVSIATQYKNSNSDSNYWTISKQLIIGIVKQEQKT